VSVRVIVSYKNAIDQCDDQMGLMVHELEISAQ
jgi:hypothetical protein